MGTTPPAASVFPGAYDGDASLLVAPTDRQYSKLASACSVSDLQVTLTGAFPALENGPFLLLFAGGEIWFVDTGEASVVDETTIITLGSIDQRGMYNTTLQPHSQNEEVYITVFADHYNLMKLAVQAAQQYGFRFGTSTQRAAYSPVAGEAWLDSDGTGIFYCFSAGTFTRINVTWHSGMAGLGDDDHTQYHNDSRANTWHGAQSGVHITSGDDHDHLSAGEGSAVLVIQAGVFASRPSATAVGQLYFATDTAEGGTLYVSDDGASWKSVSGVPAGAIAPFASACPSGWTRYTALDGKYLKVDNTSPGSSSGTGSHSHVLPSNVSHYHTISAQNSSSSTDPGSHAHQVGTEADNSEIGYNELADITQTTSTITTSAAGAHTHTASIPGRTTGSSGAASPSTNTSTGEPPYKEIVWCSKD